MSEDNKTPDAPKATTAPLSIDTSIPLVPVVENPENSSDVKLNVEAALRTIYDPEIPVDIYELGMVYDIAVNDEYQVHIQMTLTSPACPVAGTLPGETESKVAQAIGVNGAKVELVWEPPWNPDMMTEAAKLKLNMF